jgi:hypothetical protein
MISRNMLKTALSMTRHFACNGAKINLFDASSVLAKDRTSRLRSASFAFGLKPYGPASYRDPNRTPFVSSWTSKFQFQLDISAGRRRRPLPYINEAIELDRARRADIRKILALAERQCESACLRNDFGIAEITDLRSALTASDD